MRLSRRRLLNYFYYHVIKNLVRYDGMFENIERVRLSMDSKNVIVNRPPVKTKDNEMKRCSRWIYQAKLLYRDQSHDIVKYCHTN